LLPRSVSATIEPATNSQLKTPLIPRPTDNSFESTP
jgi:hypothetical protein